MVSNTVLVSFYFVATVIILFVYSLGLQAFASRVLARFSNLKSGRKDALSTMLYNAGVSLYLGLLLVGLYAALNQFVAPPGEYFYITTTLLVVGLGLIAASLFWFRKLSEHKVELMKLFKLI